MSRTDVLEWTINRYSLPLVTVSPMAFSASGDLVQFTFTAHDNTPPPPPSKKKKKNVPVSCHSKAARH